MVVLQPPKFVTALRGNSKKKLVPPMRIGPSWVPPPMGLSLKIPLQFELFCHLSSRQRLISSSGKRVWQENCPTVPGDIFYHYR